MNPLTTKWIACAERLPPLGEPVATRIDDGHSVRNEGVLKRGGMNGRLWFFADDSMYVYYTPTHWHPIDPTEGEL